MLASAAGCLLLVALAIQFAPHADAYYFQPAKPIADYLPGALPGYTQADLPLGDTEMLRAYVKKELKYDDYVFRVYRKGDVEIAVYVAYWKPHSQIPAVVGVHSPDTCWVEAGWQAVGEKREARLPIHGENSLAAQVRCFRAGNLTQYVAFWHLQGGTLVGHWASADKYDYTGRAALLFRTLWKSGFGLKEYEQYFIRISSTRPIEEVQKLPEFQAILSALGPMGLTGQGVK